MTSSITTTLSISALGLVLCSLGCGSEADDGAARFHSVNNNPGTFDTDFIGEGVVVSESFVWENSAAAAEYSMDITAGAAGRVVVVIEDARGSEVASFSLDDSSPDDSLDGVSQSGTPGSWRIGVTVSGFEGDGSLNVNSAEGDDSDSD